ncbi:MAG: hypothetical protein KIT51_07820 [Cyclobacteriaceae bacterium]|nr:MAG: hypothetical protein KIT51_07820 [Cyclobacteriaceae bacterium]
MKKYSPRFKDEEELRRFYNGYKAKKLPPITNEIFVCIDHILTVCEGVSQRAQTPEEEKELRRLKMYLTQNKIGKITFHGRKTFSVDHEVLLISISKHILDLLKRIDNPKTPGAPFSRLFNIIGLAHDSIEELKELGVPDLFIVDLISWIRNDEISLYAYKKSRQRFVKSKYND